jgi:hypothetical protein
MWWNLKTKKSIPTPIASLLDLKNTHAIIIIKEEYTTI